MPPSASVWLSLHCVFLIVFVPCYVDTYTIYSYFCGIVGSLGIFHTIIIIKEYTEYHTVQSKSGGLTQSHLFTFAKHAHLMREVMVMVKI